MYLDDGFCPDGPLICLGINHFLSNYHPSPINSALSSELLAAAAPARSRWSPVDVYVVVVVVFDSSQEAR